MSRDDLVENLGTVAQSGTQSFLSQLEQGTDLNLIGQFGVGFYSAYLVSDQVEVVSRAAGSDEAHRWSSDGQEEFFLESATRDEPGTDIILHLKEAHKDLLSAWKMRTLIQTYSDYVDHPIQIQTPRPVTDEEGQPVEGAEPTLEWETVNCASALWQRNASDIDDEQYEEFYKHLTHDWEPPLARTHFKIEGTQLFNGLLFIPKRPPFDLHEQDRRRGVRLYVKRIFIMDDCEELLPQWLRFMRGVVDTDDLPLNISREVLQDSSAIRVIRKQVIKKSLDLLESMARDKPADYADFWDKYGPVLKEGFHFDASQKERLSKLVRFSSSAGDSVVGLDEYVDRMPFSQPAIYYAMGPSRAVVEKSPHIEALRDEGYEILYLTDAIDQWVVDNLPEFREKKIVSAMVADLNLDGEKEEGSGDEDSHSLGPFGERITEVLAEHVSEVRASQRLRSSPVCLVIPQGGLHSHIEILLRAGNRDLPKTKRILEVNRDHPLIENLQRLHEAATPDSDELANWIKLLYDQALLSEGSPIDDPANFAAQMAALMTQATESVAN
jgi:molecular chaperone HtpG